MHTSQQSTSPSEISDSNSEFDDIEMSEPSSQLVFTPQYDDSSRYTVAFEESDSTHLQASAVELAVGRLAEELETFMFDDIGSESSAADLEERDISYPGL